MADNVPVTAGSGTNIATDDVSGVHYQRVKLDGGGDGAAAPILGDSANGLDVDVTRLPGIAGDVAHDGVDSGNPVKVGSIAVAHGANPTAVAAADRVNLIANRAGVPFVMGGHPNIVTTEFTRTAGDGAATDASIVSVGSGLKIVVTQIQVIADNANTAYPNVRIGFGASTLPAVSGGLATGIVLSHPGIPAGGGVNRGDGSGILGIGADGEDLRITCGAPTGGSIRVLVSHYTIES